MEHGGRRYCTHRFGTGKYVLCGKQKKIIRLPRLLCSAFYTYSSQKLPEVRLSSIAKNLVLENRDESALRGHVASVSPTFSLSRQSRDKIFQAYHAFCTVSDKSCAEAWERTRLAQSSCLPFVTKLHKSLLKDQKRF